MNQSLSQSRSRVDSLQNIAFALTILLAPVTYCLGGLLDPVIHVTDGAANVAANAAANPFTNGLHLASFVVGSFVLPISIIGIARLVMPRSPWLAFIGGALGLLGWLPMSALTAQEDLTLQMARLGVVHAGVPGGFSARRTSRASLQIGRRSPGTAVWCAGARGAPTPVMPPPPSKLTVHPPGALAASPG
jgi:hypothetical protein